MLMQLMLLHPLIIHAERDYDFLIESTSGKGTAEVIFSTNSDQSSPFTIILIEDELFEGEETFFLNFTFREATGDFIGAFIYENSSTNLECTIEDILTDGILMMCILNDIL